MSLYETSKDRSSRDPGTPEPRTQLPILLIILGCFIVVLTFWNNVSFIATNKFDVSDKDQVMFLSGFITGIVAACIMGAYLILRKSILLYLLALLSIVQLAMTFVRENSGLRDAYLYSIQGLDAISIPLVEYLSKEGTISAYAADILILWQPVLIISLCALLIYFHQRRIPNSTLQVG